MSSVQIEPHYLGSLEYYALLSQFDQIIFNVSTVFQKQTYRNRAYLLGSNRILILSIPVIASSQTVYKDVKIDYGQNWLKDHWGAFYSSYGKAPFFDYLKQDFHEVWFSKPKFLVDLVVKMHDVIGNILGELPKYRL
ncbi:MAG: WbqC family protein, partial [Bacteroidota bacterium]